MPQKKSGCSQKHFSMPRISKAVVFMQWICNRNETPASGSSGVLMGPLGPSLGPFFFLSSPWASAPVEADSLFPHHLDILPLSYIMSSYVPRVPRTALRKDLKVVRT
jgi:hypothetical protein